MLGLKKWLKNRLLVEVKYFSKDSGGKYGS